jgi:hypothetical protein
MAEHFRDDLEVWLGAYAGQPDHNVPGTTLDLDRESVDQLADALEFRFDWSSRGIGHLVGEGFEWFDMNKVHECEHNGMVGSSWEYMSRYQVDGNGHYNPRGNHLFAYAIKDKLVEILDPKPLPYQDIEAERVDFSGYLPGA